MSIYLGIDVGAVSVKAALILPKDDVSSILDHDEAASLVQEAFGEGPMIALIFDEHKLPKAIMSPVTSSLKQTARSGRITLWRNDQHGGTQSD